MNIEIQELSALRTMLENYKQQHGTIAASSTESINCYCGGSCTASCSSYCDGTGSGGGVCWTKTYNR